MNPIHMLTLSVSWCALGINSVLIVWAALNRNLREKVFRWFFILLLLNLWLILNEFTVYILGGHRNLVVDVLIRIFDFFSYAIGSLQYIAYALYLGEYIGKIATPSKQHIRFVVWINIIAIAMAGVAQFNHMYARFDDMNYYHQQDTYWISVIPTFLSMAVLTVEIFNHKKVLTPRELIALPLYFTLPVICYILEIAIIDLWLSHVGSTIAFFIIYVFIQLELKREQDIQNAKLMEGRIAVMLSQIQPHFLYNALGAIDKLYFEDPEKGHSAIVIFSNYLRGNMDSITKKTRIPFNEEFEHVKKYLWLEQLRFGKKLQVIYDIQSEDFTLPVLTLQPIVENAVRYGVTKKKGGGNVTIKTAESEYLYRIEVTDDGVGFDPEAIRRDGHGHIGISNVRDRIRSMCGGTFAIDSTPGEGTVVVIEIPKSPVKTSDTSQSKWR